MDKDRQRLTGRIGWLWVVIVVTAVLWVVSLTAILHSEIDGWLFGVQCGAALVLIILSIALVAHYRKRVEEHDRTRDPRDDREMSQIRSSDVEPVSVWYAVGILCVFLGFFFGFALTWEPLVLLAVGVVCLIVGYCMKRRKPVQQVDWNR